jgi:hypothetical protein
LGYGSHASTRLRLPVIRREEKRSFGLDFAVR